jgi:hypothetical protein
VEDTVTERVKGLVVAIPELLDERVMLTDTDPVPLLLVARCVGECVTECVVDCVGLNVVDWL